MTHKIFTQETIRPVIWQEDELLLLDQRILPQQEHYIHYRDPRAVADAIRDMVVRGAPAIGVTAAYGVVLAARTCYQQGATGWQQRFTEACDYLAQARPTAVNLVWAIRRMQQLLATLGEGDPTPALLEEAHAILAEDIAANHHMGELGAALIEEQGGAVLTHCNAGALATGGYGTALGVIRTAFKQGRIAHVYADETRPWLQGARLTAWEMVKEQIPVTLLADGAAAHLMKLGRISWVVVGSDRIAANGDVANKIGTYSAAIAARYHGVKFMVVAPTSTVDMSLASGEFIPIEDRGSAEVLYAGGTQVAAKGSLAWNPAFDVTPAALVDAIVTEKGVVLNPTTAKMAAMMRGELI